MTKPSWYSGSSKANVIEAKEQFIKTIVNKTLGEAHIAFDKKGLRYYIKSINGESQISMLSFTPDEYTAKLTVENDVVTAVEF